MKFIVFEIQTYADGSIAVLPAIVKDTRNEADSSFHGILASAALSDLPCHAAVMMTSDGNTLRSECYRHGEQE